MVEMVHDRIAAGETTVVPTAAELRCGKQMEKLPHYNFSWTVSPKTLRLEVAMDLSRDRNGLLYYYYLFSERIYSNLNARFMKECTHNCI
jgi:hypothetical protein